MARRNDPIRIAVVESDPVRFLGFCAGFHSLRGFELKAATESEVIFHQGIDVVVLAIPRRRHLFDRVLQLTAAGPDLRIVVTGAGMNEDETILKAIAVGVRGCVDETAAPGEFMAAIGAVHPGLVWAPREGGHPNASPWQIESGDS